MFLCAFEYTYYKVQVFCFYFLVFDFLCYFLQQRVASGSVRLWATDQNLSMHVETDHCRRWPWDRLCSFCLSTWMSGEPQLSQGQRGKVRRVQSSTEGIVSARSEHTFYMWKKKSFASCVRPKSEKDQCDINGNEGCPDPILPSISVGLIAFTSTKTRSKAENTINVPCHKYFCLKIQIIDCTNLQ